MILEIQSIRKSFGGLLALNDVTLSVEERQIYSIIGPNGAGKTTLFNVLSGMYKPDGGQVRFAGDALSGLSPERVAGRGVARTFQNIRLFGAMTVFENLLVGQHVHIRYNYADALFRTPRFFRQEHAARARAMELLEYMGLKDRAFDLARNLAYGEQRRLEIGRALALSPRLLLLDEPAAGMNPKETNDLKDLIRRLRDDLGITILLIEHHMQVVMAISDRISVLDYGSKIEEGTPEEIRTSPQVIEAYLGKGALETFHDWIATEPRRNGGSAGIFPRLEFLLRATVSPWFEFPMSELLLRLNDVHAYYGHIHALKGISLEIREGEIVTLIGSNGAGKSTTLKTISGLLRARQGGISFRGQAIAGRPADEITRLGVSHVPEGRRIFPRLTVEENLDIGAYLVRDARVVEQRKQEVFDLFPRIASRRKQQGGTLSGGEQQMLAIGRALMQDPKLLLLDEPTLGLAPVLVETIFETIIRLNRLGKTMLLVEQNAWHALQLAHRGYVLQTGEVILSGPAGELVTNPTVKKCYLGAE